MARPPLPLARPSPLPEPEAALEDRAFSEEERTTAGAALKSTQMASTSQGAELPGVSAPRVYRTGDVIDGKYRLEGLIGKGGMGEVWTAHNDTLGVLRALKLIPAELDSPESTDRLLREARSAARLADPAIVRVFDFGKTVWGDPYLVMELLSGEDLASIIRRRERLSATKAVRVLLPIIRALCAAHAHGIVHRDLKPENIFLAKMNEGRIQPKLLDFGIAKLKNARALRLTSDGTVIGSPLYMSPEQARGEEVDERTDVWAMCVVLYEVMMGTPPFMGENRYEVIQAAASASPESLTSRGVGDAVLWGILEQGLSKRSEGRWASMQLLGEALARWLLTQDVVDDITGASLEAAWLRKVPSSFLSSLPPENLRLPEVVIVDVTVKTPPESRYRHALAWLERAWSASPLPAQYARLERHTSPRSRRVLGAALGVVALLAVIGLSRGGASPEPTPDARALSAAPLAPPVLPDPAPAAMEPALAAPEPAPSAEPEGAVPAATNLKPVRATRKAPAARGSRTNKAPSTFAKRRSKLIDPFQ